MLMFLSMKSTDLLHEEFSPKWQFPTSYLYNSTLLGYSFNTSWGVARVESAVSLVPDDHQLKSLVSLEDNSPDDVLW